MSSLCYNGSLVLFQGEIDSVRCVVQEQLTSISSFINLLYLMSIVSIPMGTGILSAGAWGLASRRARITLAVFVSMLSFSLLDLALFKSMPFLELSFGSPRFPFLSMTVLRGLATVSGAMLLIAYLGLKRLFIPQPVVSRTPPSYWSIPFVFNLVVSGCLVDGLVVEPLSIQPESVAIVSDNWQTEAAPLRIVHISDTHIERFTRRERGAVQMVNDLDADLILMTGDYLNISFLRDPQARQAFRDFVGQLRSRNGIYAVWGNTDVPMWRDELVAGLDMTILEDEIATFQINGQPISLVGLNVHQHSIDKDIKKLQQLAPRLPQDSFNILLYHTPDLMPEVVDTDQFDLYLAGHTHGGQIRLPWYGAIVTASIYGKRYEAGLYQEGRTVLYVSRGLGFEGGSAPRVRFLCPPEITVLTLS